MKTIVAATDFSRVSINAVNYAADMACVTGAKLTLIHIYAVPVAISEIPVAAYSMEELEAEAGERMHQLVEKIRFRTGERIITETQVRPGEVLKGIEEYCETADVYAVIMGAESAAGLERFLLGGKTIAALKHLPWPLIVVPPDVRFASMRKIGLACDYKKVTDSIPFREIKSLVKEFDAELHVLYVRRAETGSANFEFIRESEWLKDMISELNPKYHIIVDTDTEKGIIDFAEKNKLDLLIIFPKKHSLSERIFHYSHSKRLVLHTHVPVMSIHE